MSSAIRSRSDTSGRKTEQAVEVYSLAGGMHSGLGDWRSDSKGDSRSDVVDELLVTVQVRGFAGPREWCPRG